jgi:hypothetical protein
MDWLQLNILVVEMGTKIWSPLFNSANLFSIYFFALATKVRKLDYNQSVDRSTKKSWPLKW